MHNLYHLHGIGGDKEVCVVEKCYLWPLHQQQEGELDEQHEGQLPYAADLQEHWASQQRQQHTVAEILESSITKRYYQQQISEKNTNVNVTFSFLKWFDQLRREHKQWSGDITMNSPQEKGRRGLR